MSEILLDILRKTNLDTESEGRVVDLTVGWHPATKIETEEHGAIRYFR
jgi:hypothetical protein